MKKNNSLGFLSIPITVSIIALPFIQPFFLYATEDNVTFTVAKAERVIYGRSSKYLIFTKDETFENTDSIAYFKFNSSDLYGQINKGKTYKAKVAGVRIPFLSWYRNIIRIQESQ